MSFDVTTPESAIRKLAYLGTAEKVRVGMINTYGFSAPIAKIERHLKAIKSINPPKRTLESLPSDAYDFDARRKSPTVRPRKEEPRKPYQLRVKPQPAKQAPPPTNNPFDGGMNFKMLAKSVASDFGLTLDDVMGARRGRVFINARAVIIRICLERGLSSKVTGNFFGGRDHSTILNLKYNYEVYERRDPRVTQSYNRHVELQADARAKEEAREWFCEVAE